MKTFYLMTMGFCLVLNLHAQRSEYLLEKDGNLPKERLAMLKCQHSMMLNGKL